MFRLFSLSAALPILAFVVACNLGKKIGDVDAGVVPGPEVITCGGDDDDPCPQDVPVCSFGVCKRPCAADDGCADAATYCDQVSGFCQSGCRESSACGAGEVCSSGNCIISQGCGTKCDCAIGQVCVAGACTDPPVECNSPDDCAKASDGECEDFACNGFTHLCFDPDPTACTSDNDCLGRPGCAAGCTCVVDSGACSTNVDCTVDNESTTCGSGFYCGGGTCQSLPACTGEADCAGFGLTCNAGLGQCERSTACASAAQCTVPPNTVCDTVAGRCAPPLCTNGGVTCIAPQTCAADGRCVTPGTGAPCTSNNQCQANEYCAPGGGAGNCAIGCRDNGSCEADQQCDGSHTCVGGGGGGLGGFNAACTDDSDCQAGLTCGALTNTCQELCDANADPDCSVSGCCQLSGQDCCLPFFGTGFCKSTGC